MAAERVPGAEGPIGIAEFEAMPPEDPYRIELVRGIVVREPRPGTFHGRVALVIGARLNEFVEHHRLGVVIGDAGFALELDPPSVRGPDLAFVSTVRIPAGAPRRGFWRVAPDLAVEVLSPANRRGALREKLAHYFATGVRCAWVVDPIAETITVHLPGETPRLRTAAEVLDGHPVLSGFIIRVAEVFARL